MTTSPLFERRGCFQFKHQLPKTRVHNDTLATSLTNLWPRHHCSSKGLNTITRVNTSLALTRSPADPSGFLGVNDLSTSISFPPFASVRCVVSHPSGVALSVRCTGPRWGISLKVVLRNTVAGAVNKTRRRHYNCPYGNKNKLTVAEEFRFAPELFLPFAYWVY